MVRFKHPLIAINNGGRSWIFLGRGRQLRIYSILKPSFLIYWNCLFF